MDDRLPYGRGSVGGADEEAEGFRTATVRESVSEPFFNTSVFVRHVLSRLRCALRWRILTRNCAPEQTKGRVSPARWGAGAGSAPPVRGLRRLPCRCPAPG